MPIQSTRELKPTPKNKKYNPNENLITKWIKCEVSGEPKAHAESKPLSTKKVAN
jgi:hypothetical protein